MHFQGAQPSAAMHFKDSVCFARELHGDTTFFFVAWGHLILECHYIAVFTSSSVLETYFVPEQHYFTILHTIHFQSDSHAYIMYLTSYTEASHLVSGINTFVQTVHRLQQRTTGKDTLSPKVTYKNT